MLAVTATAMVAAANGLPSRANRRNRAETALVRNIY
jgi:hypothetical protein